MVYYKNSSWHICEYKVKEIYSTWRRNNSICNCEGHWWVNFEESMGHTEIMSL